MVRRISPHLQCDQIGRFFALWATIQSWWQQLFYPNHPHCYEIFVKVLKSFIFLVKSFLANYYDIWRFLSGHTDYLSLHSKLFTKLGRSFASSCRYHLISSINGVLQQNLLQRNKKIVLFLSRHAVVQFLSWVLGL